MPASQCGAPDRQDTPSVAAVLRRFLRTTRSGLRCPPHVLKILRRLSRCFTGELGWALWQCERCSAPHWRPLGCGDRHCPQCTTRAGEAWLEKQRRAILPVRYFHWVFTHQGKFIAGLDALRAEGALQFHGRLESWRYPAVWDRTLRALRGNKWIVFAKGSVTGPESVLEYLGRYTHRVAISNGRIVRLDEKSVTFRYKHYRDDNRLKEMTLGGVEFVRRLSLHILPPGFTKIRHYGILGNNRRATLVPLARQALEHSPWRLDSPPLTRTPAPKAEASGCPRCGSDDIVCLGRLDPSGRFTALRRGALRLRLVAGEPTAIQDSS